MPSRDSRIVLITGCSSGIGRALVPVFRERGCHVVATARTPEKLAELAGPQVTTKPLDVTDEARCEGLINEIVAEHGRLDMLVNNAGFSAPAPLIESSREELAQHLEVLLLAPMVLARYAATAMIPQRRGTIVNIGSVNALIAGPFSGAYGGAKAALHTMSDTLRLELHPWGLHVVCVHTGGVRTNIRGPLGTHLEAKLAAGTAYERELRTMLEMTRTIDNNWMRAETFARKLVPRLLRRTPPRTVRLGTHARLTPCVHRWLPQAWQEALLRRMFQLRKR